MMRKRYLGLLLTGIVIGLAAACAVVYLSPGLPFRPAPVVEIRPTSAPSAESGRYSYAEAVRRAAPAVVNIYSARVVQQRASPAFRDPILEYFFGDRGHTQIPEKLETNLGSGVIVSVEGYVLTNNHVIDGASEIRVMLNDERSLIATVVGTDPETDLAVLRIDARGLPAILVETDALPQVGDIALAIGNPFGVGQTVTLGIISATGRDDLGINTFENFIQTDAAINPGNSGGALINAHGDLIGINSAIFSRSGGSQGIGFAIPSALAIAVMEQIIEHGHAVRGWLGIEAQTLTDELADSFGLPKQRGVVVAGVIANSPADSAGLMRGDIITHVDEEPTVSARDVLNVVAKHLPGQGIGIRGLRDGRPFEVHAEIGQRPPRR